MPILPSYKASIYTLAPTLPRDPLVRELLGDLPYDEALAGAATALSLILSQGELTDSADVNWACQRSGWPYPLSAHRQLVLPKDTAPDGLLEGLSLSSNSRLGVVRARSSESDIWILLQSEVEAPLSPVAMRYAIGDRLELPNDNNSPLTWRATDPTGTLQLPENQLHLQLEGEWLIEASRRDQILFRAALYVDMDTPEIPLFEFEAPSPDLKAQENQAWQMVSLAHQMFFATEEAIQRDPSLDRSAAMALKAALNGKSVSSAQLRFEQLGFTRLPRNEVGCTGGSVRECLDGLYWSAETRGQLFDVNHGVMGVAVSELPDGNIALMLNLASE